MRRSEGERVHPATVATRPVFTPRLRIPRPVRMFLTEPGIVGILGIAAGGYRGVEFVRTWRLGFPCQLASESAKAYNLCVLTRSARSSTKQPRLPPGLFCFDRFPCSGFGSRIAGSLVAAHKAGSGASIKNASDNGDGPGMTAACRKLLPSSLRMEGVWGWHGSRARTTQHVAFCLSLGTSRRCWRSSFQGGRRRRNKSSDHRKQP